MRLTLFPTLRFLFAAGCITAAAAAPSPGQDRQWIAYEGADGKPGAGKKVVLISGDEEYRSEEAMPMLGKILARRHGFDAVVLFAIDPESGEIDPNNQNNIPGLHELDDADMMIIATRFRELPDDQMKHIVDFVNSGKPMMGLRTATHAFKYSDESESVYKRYSFDSREWPGGFGQQVLGETWINHHGHHKVESTRGVVNPKHADHPVLNGVEDIWGPTDVYGVRNLGDDAKVLVHGQVLKGMNPGDEPVDGPKNDPMMPLVWLREFTGESGRTSRIITTTMGASTDLESEGLRRLLVNAVYWALDLEVPDSADVDPVGDYSPTMYGFNEYKKGVKPADHAVDQP